jgi:hypothetical protein
MAENLILAARKKAAEVSATNSILAARPTSVDTSAKAQEAADNWHNQAPANPDDIKRSALMAQYNKLPFLQKFDQGMDDVVKTALSGLSYGLYDKIAPEAADSRARMGSAALPIDIISTLRSPITKVIGAGANAIRPVAAGFLPALAKLGITAGEGAAMAGTDSAIRNNGDIEQIKQDATLGGGLSAGAEALMSHIIPGTGKMLASTFSGVPRQVLSDTFKVASESKAGSDAISAVRAGTPPVELQDQIVKLRKALGKVDLIPSEKAIIQNALTEAETRFKTTSGLTDLDSTDATNVKKLVESAKDTKTGKWLLNHLDDLSAYLESTKVAKAEGISNSGRTVNETHDIIKDLGSKIDPRFGNLMDFVNTLNKARAAGTATKKWLPEKSMAGTLLQAGGIAGSPLLGAFGLASPLVATLLTGLAAGTIPLGSPKIVGKVAQTSGNTKRVLEGTVKALTGSKPTYGQLGLVADPVAKKLGLNKGQR